VRVLQPSRDLSRTTSQPCPPPSSSMPLRCVSLIACALAGVALLVAVPAAEAQDVSPLVAYRKATMNGVRIHREALAALASGDVAHPDHVAYHTSALLGLAMMSGDIFPTGSGGEG